MISLELWKSIIKYIEIVKESSVIDGVLICGSLPNNKYQKGSDVDLLFLTNDLEFSMKTVLYEDIIFDTMLSPILTIKNILSQETELSDILSLSFGSSNLIIDELNEIRNIIEISEQNIKNRT